MAKTRYWVERRTSKTHTSERWTLEAGYQKREDAERSASWFRQEYRRPARVVKLHALGCFTIRVGQRRVTLHANSVEEALVKAVS